MRVYPLVHSLITAALLSLPWYSTFSGLFLLVAFVPLLVLEEQFSKSGEPAKLFCYSSLAFLGWNAGATYWTYHSSWFGLAGAFSVNTFLFALVFQLYHITGKFLGRRKGYLALVFYWVAFEHLYLQSPITWPWLNLGNGFAGDPWLVQWYEYTGTAGGTAWVLATNIIVHELGKWIYSKKPQALGYSHPIALLLVVCLPISISLARYYTYREKSDPREIVIVQPNIDPYTEKHDGIPMPAQLARFTRLADSLLTPRTRYLLGPETLVEDYPWIHDLGTHWSIDALKPMTTRWPGLSIIVGITCLEAYPGNAAPNQTATLHPGRGVYHDTYNSAIQVDTSPRVPIYHKSKLVTGVETLPWGNRFPFPRRWLSHLGGSLALRGTQDHRAVFVHATDSSKVAPAICYESVFGDFVTGFTREGAGLILVLTNDGWWGTSPGYRQHHDFSRLRAIENRRSIARCANTGVSSFIDQRGNVVQSTPYGVQTAIRGELNYNTRLSFYARFGDYLGRVAVFLSVMMLLYTLAARLTRGAIFPARH